MILSVGDEAGEEGARGEGEGGIHRTGKEHTALGFNRELGDRASFWKVKCMHAA